MIYNKKIAIVTGGASGIGLELARQLREHGATVVIADVQQEMGTQKAAELNAEFYLVDVSDAVAVKDMVESVIKTHGHLDYIFNNAGILVSGRVDDTPLADWDRIFAINVRGVVNGINAAYPIFIQQGFGHIVNTASIAGLIPCPGLVAYSATKHAVVGISTGLRLEAARHGVNVSVACPGFVKTRILDNATMHKVDASRLTKGVSWESPQSCAKDILAGVAKNQDVIIVTRHGKIATTLQRISPSLLQWATKRMSRRK